MKTNEELEQANEAYLTTYDRWQKIRTSERPYTEGEAARQDYMAAKERLRKAEDAAR